MSHRWLRRWGNISLTATLVILGCTHPQRDLTSSAKYNYASSHVYPALSSPVIVPAPDVVDPSTTPVEQAVADPTLPTAPADSANPEVKAAAFENATVGAREENVPRRSYADISAKSCYGHAPDYTWLTGELQMLHPSKTWHLRFASVDEEDRFGGSVTLAETGAMDSFTSGQCVRVEGALDNAESHGRSPLYHVRSIKAIPHP